MIDHVVVDVEIQKTVEETSGGWEATDQLGVSVACLWEYRTQRMRVYGPEDVPALCERLLQADRISGYNIHRFDFPVIWGVSRADWDRQYGSSCQALKAVLFAKTDDLLARIWRGLGLDANMFSDAHKGWGLDAVAGATLNARKIGYGGDAPKWYQAGQIQRVVNYCADDVALERDLADFVDRYGFVVGSGERVVRLPPWEGLR
jgi:DEAD/DEAH box helicase domain-containing protein